MEVWAHNLKMIEKDKKGEKNNNFLHVNHYFLRKRIIKWALFQTPKNPIPREQKVNS
jgi:hypothetical protein